MVTDGKHDQTENGRSAEAPDGAPDQASRQGPAETSLAAGVALLRKRLTHLPGGPGVYRMIDRKGDVLYVGKAKSVRKRVTSYTRVAKLPDRLRRMVAETVALEVVSTHTEVEALLLESNLIKKLRPRYNVLLRDDKSFPYIHITDEPDRKDGPEGAARAKAWARLTKYRGNRGGSGTFYGPFASAGAVNRTLGALQRAFLLRTCSDGVFAGRSRPCLLYQIKRCSGPCVGRISRDDYDGLVQQAKDFLSGRSKAIQRELAEQMEAASSNLEYEQAAYFRDRIQALSQIQARQDINFQGFEDVDVVAAYREGGQTCIQVFFFRGGRNYGNRAYYPRHDRNIGIEAVLAAFLGQFYENKLPPREVLISHAIEEHEVVAAALAVRADRKVALVNPKRGAKRKVVEHALANARSALAQRLAESASQRRLLDGIADALGLDAAPERIEVYDNSHISGSNPVGAMIVAGPEGFIKSAYRKFNIKGVKPVRRAQGLAEEARPIDGAPDGMTPGDDYAMMREVLSRRFSRALKEDPEREDGTWPDLIIIDGGAGQLSAAREALADLGIEDVPAVGMAKGPDRDAGREVFHLGPRETLTLNSGDSVLYFLQRLRDEAHRFAIGAHRTRRKNAAVKSMIDDVPGIGAKRKRALLNHFGSARETARAGLTDLESVEGISKTFAKKIYDYFHGDG